MYRGALLMACLALGLACGGCRDNAVIAEGGDFVLTPEDLRFEVYKIGPSYDFEDTYEARLTLVEHLAARHFLAQEAVRRGYGEDGLADATTSGEATAVGEAYNKWKIEKRVRVPRVESKQVLDYLDRKIHVKQMVFAVYPVAEEALAEIKAGDSFDSIAESIGDREDIKFMDHGLKIWKEFDREMAMVLFRLAVGENTGIIQEKMGYSIYYLAGTESWGADPRLIYLRSKRVVRWSQEAELTRLAREELSRKYRVRLYEEGVGAALQCFAMAFRNEMPPEDLFNVNMVSYTVKGKEVTYAAGYFFNYYWSLPAASQPYVGDMHAIEEFGLDTILFELQTAAGYALGLERTREVVWSVRKAREEFLIPKIEEAFGIETEIAESDIMAYYSEHQSEMRTPRTYRVRRILLDSEEKASLVVSEIQAGKDFAQVALERSLDVYSAPQGGDLGYVQAGMFAQYDSLVADRNPGDIVGPFVSTQGFEILKLEDQTQSSPMSLEESKGYIETTLRDARANQVLLTWVENQKKAAGFSINLKALREIAIPEPAWKASIAKESPEEEQLEPGEPIKGKKARDRARRREESSNQGS